MTWCEYIASERYQLLSNAIVAAVGFFVALYANSWVDEWKERKSFSTTLSAIRAEANSNEIAFRESFQPFFRDGLVLREFGTTLVAQALANPLFVKHATAKQLEVIAEYLRNLSLSNAYRAKAETIRFSDNYFKKANEQSVKHWEPGLITSWETNLAVCQQSIAEVETL